MNLLTPSSRDWPEDASHENGNYLCRCCSCYQTFIGYKRRVTCKVCAEGNAAKAKERAEWMAAHGAPPDWVVVTTDECDQQTRGYMDLLHRFHVEQRIRRELTKQVSDLLFQMECAATMDMGFASNHPMLKDVRAAVERAEALDQPSTP